MPKTVSMEGFLEYLRGGEVPEHFLTVYRAEAETFLKAFPDVDPLVLDSLHVAQHLDTARRLGASERALKNLRTVCDALLAYVSDRKEAALVSAPRRRTTPAPAARSPQPAGVATVHTPRGLRIAGPPTPQPLPAPMAAIETTDHRRHKRIPFIKEVEVVGVGRRRCSDISAGGLYLETVNTFPADTVLTIRFKLRDSDPDPVTAKARVAYEHPGLGLGLSFVAMTPDDKQRLEAFVRSHG